MSYQPDPAPLPVIQCSTGPLWALGLEAALDVIAEAGFTQIELMVTRDPSTQSPELPRRLAEERGLRIAALHAPFLIVTRSVWGWDPIEKIRRGAEMSAAVGATTMVVHPPLLWEAGYGRWVREEMEGFALGAGIEIAVETMYPAKVGSRSVAGYRWIKPELLARAASRVVLDTSHVAVAGHNLLGVRRLFGSQLAHVHLSDNAGDGRDGHLEIGQGVLPLERLLDDLCRSGFAGGICLELALGGVVDRHDVVVATLRRNREYLEAALAGRAPIADSGHPGGTGRGQPLDRLERP
ncbi:MAG: sugar phosphate isomerase/epimerase [Actinobacteria bacterium]|nr:sugar phosphate isomerase/epimerase [Actinomycetota bacterium]